LHKGGTLIHHLHFIGFWHNVINIYLNFINYTWE
jgi:hypothetical protein